MLFDILLALLEFALVGAQEFVGLGEFEELVVQGIGAAFAFLGLLLGETGTLLDVFDFSTQLVDDVLEDSMLGIDLVDWLGVLLGQVEFFEEAHGFEFEPEKCFLVSDLQETLKFLYLLLRFLHGVPESIRIQHKVGLVHPEPFHKLHHFLVQLMDFLVLPLVLYLQEIDSPFGLRFAHLQETRTED